MDQNLAFHTRKPNCARNWSDGTVCKPILYTDLPNLTWLQDQWTLGLNTAGHLGAVPCFNPFDLLVLPNKKYKYY